MENWLAKIESHQHHPAHWFNQHIKEYKTPQNILYNALIEPSTLMEVDHNID